MARRRSPLSWLTAWQRGLGQLARTQWHAGQHTLKATTQKALARRKPPAGPGDWLTGYATAASGVRKFHLYRPPGVLFSERLPLIVMLHGCQQDGRSFARSTRMNRLADRERFFVLYPEQDRRANANGCWNWHETRSGMAHAEAAILLAAVRQVCLLYPVDPTRVAVAGLSAGASMAALLATRHPEYFKAVVMHSGVPPGVASNSATAFGAMRGRRSPARPEVASAGDWPPVLVIHGQADAVVSARNASAAAELWAAASGAKAAAPRRIQRGKRHAMTVTDFKRGRQTVASLCEVGTLGHAWSGGAARLPYSDAQGPDASRLVWAFAQRQFGPR